MAAYPVNCPDNSLLWDGFMKSALAKLVLKIVIKLFGGPRPTFLDVFYAYRMLLGRNPDEGGWLDYWREIRRVRYPFYWLSDQIQASDEYRKKIGQNRTFETIPVEEEIVSLPDFKLVVDKNDTMVGQTIQARGKWEPWVTKAIKTLLKPGMIFVDVGANIGFFTLLASTLVGPEGRVIAVEPLPQNNQLLAKSIQLNKCQNVELHAVAAGPQSGTMKMCHAARYNSGSFHFENPENPKQMTWEMEIRPLDDILAGRKPDIVKIDVEGGEALVLAGMGETLAKHHPLVLMEYSDNYLRDVSRVSGQEMLARIKDLGYEFQDIEMLDGGLKGQSIQELEAAQAAKGSSHLDLVVFHESLKGKKAE
jgi:FkbM family methyltransferase